MLQYVTPETLTMENNGIVFSYFFATHFFNDI